MTEPKVLTSEHVAQMKYATPFIHPPSASRDVCELCDSHEALRAQVAALQTELDEARKGWTLEQAQAQVRDFNIVCDEVRKHRSRAEAAEQRIAATVAWLEAEQRQRCDTWPVPADDILARLAATECTGEK